MPLASRSLLPRLRHDDEHLNRLRARALVRMQEDEQAAGVSPMEGETRRGVLRRFGFLLAGLVPGVAALVKGQAALAAVRKSGARVCAPQYGAPSWPVSDMPRERVTVAPSAVTRSREELSHVKAWTYASAFVLTEKGDRGEIGFRSVSGKQGFYDDGWGGGLHRLLAFAAPDSDMAYIVRGDQTFYAAVDGVMYGYFLGSGVLSVHASLLQRKVATLGREEGLAAIIADFAQVSDRAAYEKDSQGKTIDLEKGLPQDFWIRNGERGWVENRIWVMRVRRAGDVAQLDVRSDGYQSPATFTLDLKGQKLLKTKFEGKEWAA